MARISSRCPRDGEVDFAVTDCLQCPDTRTYVFVCPACGEPVIKEMNKKARDLLTAVGVRTVDDIVAEECGELHSDVDIWRAVLA